LKKKGIAANQVTVSRDMAELGLVKAAGFYRAAPTDAPAADPEAPPFVLPPQPAARRALNATTATQNPRRARPAPPSICDVKAASRDRP